MAPFDNGGMIGTRRNAKTLKRCRFDISVRHSLRLCTERFSVWIALVGGCAASGLSPLQYSLRQTEGGDRTRYRRVFETAQRVLIDFGYNIDRADRAAGIITTQPTQTASDNAPARPGVGLSSRGSIRRFAEVRLAPGATGLNLYCKVVIQEQTTEAYRMFRSAFGGSDTPEDTAIDREAATTTEQNTVWQTIRRDKTAERRILEAILIRNVE